MAQVVFLGSLEIVRRPPQQQTKHQKQQQQIKDNSNYEM